MQETINYPKISIITPSYNQGLFIEQTIDSVLSQNYPNLEYIIIDGHSTDNTVEIIKKYDSAISYWVSEPDNGQTHAINKGLKKATGEIIAYINSDDYYLPGALLKVSEYFHEFPNTDLLHGKCRYVNQKSEKINEQFGNIQTVEEILDIWNVWWKERQFVQPEVFWSRRIFEKIGFFNENLYYVMDYEYWCRIFLEKGVIGSIDDEIACFRFTENQKSNDSSRVADEQRVVIRSWLWNFSIPISLKKRLFLQGQWAYDAIFLKQVEHSINQQEVKIVRLLKSFNIIFQYPQILLIEEFRKRSYSVIFGNLTKRNTSKK